MKRILISLGVVVVVAAGVAAGTNALFNDTETSTGNIFTAGSIDLKVDHKKASYNNKDCVKDCVEDTGTNLITNGDFEVPEVTNTAKWQIFPDGTTNLAWRVAWEPGASTYNNRPRPEPALVEYHENVMAGWVAQSGDQYAELDSDWYGPQDPLNGEPALINIYQEIATVPGNQYRLHYYFSPRPSTGSGENILYVRLNGVLEQTVGPLAGGSTTSWTEHTYTFTATTTTTKVEFAGGGTNNSLGVFLDNVSLHPYNCNYTIVGGTCTLWEEKDLTDGDYFYHFDDVKPGDYGTNLISLHVDSNNAYTCLAVKGQDNEMTLTQPEINVGDTTPGPTGDGELSKYLKVFVWADDGDGVYEGETTLAGPNQPIDDAIAQLALVSGQTDYMGIAWCAGTQSVNGTTITCNGAGNQDDAQTDSYVADVTAYAVQQRNNPNFSCEQYLNPKSLD